MSRRRGLAGLLCGLWAGVLCYWGYLVGGLGLAICMAPLGAFVGAVVAEELLR